MEIGAGGRGRKKEEKLLSVDPQNKEQTAAAISLLGTNEELTAVGRHPQYVFQLLLWIKSYIKERHSSAG